MNPVSMAAPRHRIGAFHQCVGGKLLNLNLTTLEHVPRNRAMFAVGTPENQSRHSSVTASGRYKSARIMVPSRIGTGMSSSNTMLSSTTRRSSMPGYLNCSRGLAGTRIPSLSLSRSVMVATP
jgi:hypothetical protein